MKDRLDLLASEYAIKLIDVLAATKGHRAVKLISEKLVVRATRRRYKVGKNGKHYFDRNSFEVQITAGRPNYRERELIKTYKKAGVKFPCSKINVQY